MIPRTVRFYKPKAKQRVAEIAVEPSLDRDAGYLVRLSRGASVRELQVSSRVGPYPQSELEDRFTEVEQALRGEGYLPAGLPDMLSDLQSSNAGRRAHAALRLGWRRSREAVDAILARVPQAVDDVCALLDALGAIGDPRAIPLLRQQATRKLLSRRRSAVEALRNLQDGEGLTQARQQALERLPPEVRSALAALNENAPNAAALAQLVEHVQAVPLSQRGLVLDALYELATPAAISAVRAVLRQTTFGQAHIWRYVKSVLKRAELRHDYITFGEIVHAIERQGRGSIGTTATVKSGYDGKERSTRIFGRQTQLYLRRAAWRFLRNLARYRPEAYPWAAAEAIIPYDGEDAAVLPTCYLLHRVLHGSVPGQYDRFRLSFHPLNKKLPVGVREEAFPELWDAQPRAYLRVLGGARLPEVLDFAVRAITQRHPEVLTNASHAEVLAILQAPHDAAVQLALNELERRFNPQHPDWELLRLLTSDERPKARELGMSLLRLSAPAWTRDPERIIDFLATPHAEMRDLVIALARKTLSAERALRAALARRLLVLFRTLETVAGAHEGAVQLAREALTEELAGLITVAELADLIQGGAPAVQSLAGDLLRRRPDVVAELGLERLTDLAQHEIAAVRGAVHALLRAAEARLKIQPAPLFVLVESDWADTRDLAFDLLRRVIDPETVNLDALLGLLDSNRVDVQDLGKELTTQHFDRLDAEDLAYRLAQHPHPNMRRFALDLVVKHLPDGASPLGQLRTFFRAALFDLWPSRAEKRRVLDFLAERGLRDEQQAEVAVGILGDVARMQGRADFERALAALVRIKLAFPEVEATLNLRGGGEP